MIDDKQINITDEDGTENKYEILFTFVGDDSDVQYVLYFDPENPEDVGEYLIKNKEETFISYIAEMREYYKSILTKKNLNKEKIDFLNKEIDELNTLLG